MLSQYFMSQEDTQLAGVYMNEYEASVQRLVANQASKPNAARPMILGRNNGGFAPSFMDRVRGSLE